MALLRPNFRTKSDTQNAGNGISGVQISKFLRGGMPPNPPSIASITAMIPSDLRLDPPLLFAALWKENLLRISKIYNVSRVKIENNF